MSSQNSRCYWKTKDWNLLVFWSLPPSAHKPSIHLDSHSWKRCTFIRCSASLWSQPHCLCPITELAFLSLPLLETEASSATGCSTAFGTLHLWLVFFPLTIHRHRSCNNHSPKVLIIQRNKRDSRRGNWVTEGCHSSLKGEIACF